MGAEQGKEERVPELRGRLKNEVHGKRRHLHAEAESLEVLRRARNLEDARRDEVEKQKLKKETKLYVDDIVTGITDFSLIGGVVDALTKPDPTANKQAKDAADEDEEADGEDEVVNQEGSADKELKKRRKEQRALKKKLDKLEEGKYVVVTEDEKQEEEVPAEPPAEPEPEPQPEPEIEEPNVEEVAPDVEVEQRDLEVQEVLPEEPVEEESPKEEPPAPTSAIPAEPKLIYT